MLDDRIGWQEGDFEFVDKPTTQQFMAVGQPRDSKGKWTKGVAIGFDKNPINSARYRNAPDNGGEIMSVADAKLVRQQLAQQGRLNDDGRTVSVYHVTMSDNLAEIDEHGLVPSANPPPGQDFKATHSDYATYFHSSKDAALADLERVEEYDPGAFKIVEARIPITPKSIIRMIPDEDFSPSTSSRAGLELLLDGGPIAYIGGVPSDALSVYQPKPGELNTNA